MSKEGFEACNVRAVSSTTCSISRLATLNFIQHFNNTVTRSQDPSPPFTGSFKSECFGSFCIINTPWHPMLQIVLKVLIGGADGLRCWPLTSLSCHKFSTWKEWSSLSSGSSLKGFASMFFPEFHCFSSGGAGVGFEVNGELLAAQLPVHPFPAGDHLSLTCGLLPFMSHTCS